MKRALLALALSLACGKSDPGLDGTWGIQLNQACGVVLTLDTKAGSYVTQLICGLAGGGFGSDFEAGTADFSRSGVIAMMPTRVSCPTGAHTSDVSTYNFDNGHLVLSSAQGGAVGVFEHAPAGGSSGNALLLLGCWEMGTFTQHPVQPL